MSSKYLVSFMQTRENNFDIIRFFCAVIVVFSHAYPLTLANDNKEPLFVFTNQVTFGGLAVAVFFIISGFLITQSFERSSSLTSYFKSRVLRLFPGLLVCLLFSAFVLGATVTTLSIGDYFSNILAYKYFIGISLLPNLSPSLPGVFETNPFGSFVNGSLWTLKFEFLLYIAIALIGKLALLRKKFVVLCFISTVLLTFPNINSDIHNLFMLSSYFCGGILIYLFRDRIKLKGSYAFISLILLLISSQTGCFIALFAIFGSYLVIYVGYQQNFKFYNFAKYGDLSYGIYIYAFPIQQTITAIIGSKITPFQNFIVSLPIIIVLAFMSWHLVEKRALRLKHSKYINNLSISI